MTPLQTSICLAFENTCDDFAADLRSTEFLLQHTADTCGVEYWQVVEALHQQAQEEQAKKL